MFIDYIEVPVDLVEDIAYNLARFAESSNKLDSAQHLLELLNSVSDLMSYHPEYDDEYGTLPYEREEEKS